MTFQRIQCIPRDVNENWWECAWIFCFLFSLKFLVFLLTSYLNFVVFFFGLLGIYNKLLIYMHKTSTELKCLEMNVPTDVSLEWEEGEREPSTLVTNIIFDVKWSSASRKDKPYKDQLAVLLGSCKKESDGMARSKMKCVDYRRHDFFLLALGMRSEFISI